MPEVWRETIHTQHAIEYRWWEEFGDSVLNELVQQALCYNQEIQEAMARIDEFRARLGQAASKLYPDLSVGGIAQRQKISNSVLAAPNGQEIFNIFGYIFNVSYMGDLWGEVRNAVKAARYNYLAAIKAEEVVLQSIVISVVDSYVQLLQADRQFYISQKTLRDREEALDQAKLRFELGLTSLMPVEQAITQVEDAKVQVATFEKVINEMENMISLLVGRTSEETPRGRILEELILPPSVPSYCPVEIICQRPDIREAEFRLIAANADIGVAHAQFFPKLNPFASWGSESSTWRALTTSPAEIWSYGATVVQELFTGGRLTSGVYLSMAQKEELLHGYLQTVLNGLREVNDAIVAHRIALEIVEDQKTQVQALKEYLKLAFLRYEEGEDDYLTYLDAERHLFNGQLQLEKAIGNTFSSYAQIYEALGGSWVGCAN